MAMELSLERDDLMQTGPTGPGTMRVRDPLPPPPPPPPPPAARSTPASRVSHPREPTRLFGHASPPAQRQISNCRGGLLKPRCGELLELGRRVGVARACPASVPGTRNSHGARF